MTSWLGAVVTSCNVLLSMETHNKQGLFNFCLAHAICAIQLSEKRKVKLTPVFQLQASLCSNKRPNSSRDKKSIIIIMIIINFALQPCEK